MTSAPVFVFFIFVFSIKLKENKRSIEFEPKSSGVGSNNCTSGQSYKQFMFEINESSYGVFSSQV